MTMCSYTDVEIHENHGIDLTPYVTVICAACDTITKYMQDTPGNRCFDTVYCDNPDCRLPVGKT